MSQPAFDYRRLTLDERLRLVGDIWDSIAEEAQTDPSVLPLTDTQRAELDRRLAEHERDPSSAVPWEEALERIQNRLRNRRGDR
jgi:putative addiction module component (TIGR02574 family)